MTALQDYLDEQKRKRRRRRRWGLGIVILVMILLLLLRTCEAKDSGQSKVINTPKKSGSQLADFSRPPANRSPLNDQRRPPLSWAAKLNSLIQDRHEEIQSCLDSYGQDQVEWSFQYNPRSGVVSGSILLNRDGYLVTNGCLAKILTGPFYLHSASKYRDHFYNSTMIFRLVAAS
ncbi:hypothetical protein [Pseudobacteriovorax antillogorgiicola]|uniref:Uncharacterized protein n=1 Tax=Pseudobacteriovorax antillogorgiicola TaxID=1513793 RepID=A0A1Y6CLE4_9BACT|nr:hypothetical protein [Pseudobacteriovorax antillogorgiicola]TCS45911.1 hypothetical protein EDD56_12674 [Pseudobacteriovorax antillogorgiicola]SMF71084.1 hypothetical protein SAMN06296036_12624 [Pseudobacteriovorax antillogorgiicola]